MQLGTVKSSINRWFPGKLTLCRLILLVFCGVFIAAPRAVLAETATSSGYDPRSADRRVDEQIGVRDKKDALPQIARPNWTQAESGTKPLFKLQRVVVEGARTIPAATLEASYRHFIGKRVSQADLAAIAEAISAAYRAEGCFVAS